jgi:hypothetical protein
MIFMDLVGLIIQKEWTCKILHKAEKLVERRRKEDSIEKKAKKPDPKRQKFDCFHYSPNSDQK